MVGGESSGSVHTRDRTIARSRSCCQRRCWRSRSAARRSFPSPSLWWFQVKLKLWGAAAAALVLLWVALEVRALLHHWLPHRLPVWVKPLALTLPPALLVAYVTLRVVATRRLLASQVCYA